MVAADAHQELLGTTKGVSMDVKVTLDSNEHTLLLAKSEEEVHPLPWFRSPEWTKRSSPPPRNPSRGQREGVSKSVCPSLLPCCYKSSASDAGPESEMELGNLVWRPANASEIDDEADSFKQCIQFVVGLMVIMAMALILLIIFQPKPDGSR